MSALKCFVIMPFEPCFEPVFALIRETATDAVPGESIVSAWLKDARHAGKITDDIVDALHSAALCVADVTGNNPNVMWETGYAQALGRPTILIGQSVEGLAFDLRDHRVLPYDLQSLGDLGRELREALRQTLARYDVGAQPRALSEAPSMGPTIAVTGSTHAHPERTRRRVETVLSPYLGSGATWYAGTVGTVDECVVSHLLAKGERVMAVAYHRYDFSDGVREAVQTGALDYVDASLEALPKGLSGPSARDTFFAAKADLIVLLWDGASSTTNALAGYFKDIGKNTLLAFI